MWLTTHTLLKGGARLDAQLDTLMTDLAVKQTLDTLDALRRLALTSLLAC